MWLTPGCRAPEAAPLSLAMKPRLNNGEVQLLNLSILKPSVNNMTVRVFVRAAGLEFTEADVYGHTRSDAFLAKCPAHSTPLIEADDLPKGALWESCAIMQYLCNKHHLEGFYPSDPARRAMIDSAMFYIT